MFATRYYRIFTLICLGFLSGCRIASTTNRDSPFIVTTYSTVPFEVHGGWILIRADGVPTPAYFVLDTGAAVCVLDSMSFPAMVSRSYLNSDVAREVLTPPHARAGPFDVARYGSCATIETSRLSNHAGVRVIGIIGQPAFTGGILQIDFRRHELRVLPSTAHTQVDWGMAKALKYQHGVWTCSFVVNGVAESLSIDTGSDAFITANEHLQKFISSIPGVKRTSVNGISFAGDAAVSEYQLKELLIDGHKYTNVTIDATANLLSGVGIPFLSNFYLTLDFPTSTVYLEPE